MTDVAALLPEEASPIAETPAGRGAAVGLADAHGGPAAAAGQALRLRDQALAALDEGDPGAALAASGEALAALERAGLGDGPDAAAVLVARAEIEESLDRFGDAAATAAAAAALLDRVMAEDEDDDCLMLWCQAQERLAGLERLARGLRRGRGPAGDRAGPGVGGVRRSVAGGGVGG